MSSPILTTKLYIPPARTELVPRARLTERLTIGWGRTPSLSLVSAPPGFGKTTLISSWIYGLERAEPEKHRAAWLSLDEQDNDPVRFWSYVVTALERVRIGVGGSVMALLQAAEMSVADLATL